MKSAETFDDFYHATRNRLLHQMYAMTGNLADAQDCVQEAYARAWQRWEQVSEHASPEAWLRTVAWRIAASRWRKFRNGVAALARHGPPSHAPEPSPDNVALVEALKQIPEAQRRTIVLHHLADLPVEEVAKELGVATGTVKARLSRGRAALAELLRDEPERASGHVVRAAEDQSRTNQQTNQQTGNQQTGNQQTGDPAGDKRTGIDNQSTDQHSEESDLAS